MKSFFVELENFETVLVSGPDAAKFLQGQLTCDVQSLAENAFTYGAACNNKGRIFAAFILARHGENFHVSLDHGLSKIFMANLQKFIPFYKCSMQLLSSMKSIGLAGADAADVLAKLNCPIPHANTASEVAGVWMYSIEPDSTRFILSAHEGAYSSLKSSLASSSFEGTRDNWGLKNILSGHFPFELEDVEKYTPQELHFDQTGYVSFSKGCYTGQEIIARMHYRGKVKKQLYLLRQEKFSDSADREAIEIYDDSGKHLGSSLKQMIDDNQTLFAIASLPLDHATANLHTKDGKTFTYHPLIVSADPGSSANT